MKKYIVTTAGGLGNQMMNYALWFYLKHLKNKDAILYPKRKDLNDHNGYELNKLFPNTEMPHKPSQTIDMIIKLWAYLRMCNKFLPKITFIKYIPYRLPFCIIDFPLWDDYTFINNFKDQFKEIFQFTKDEDTRNQKLIAAMHDTDSVSIHVRRGDYQNVTYWRMALGDICDKKYYIEAIKLVTDRIKNPSFYIFSDDIQWTKENLPLPNAVYINWNQHENSFRDMQLMANCKVNIIANSTFSLMATWLNVHSNCWRIAPKKWRNYYNDTTYLKYLPSNWTLINNEHPNISFIFKGDSKTIKQQWIHQQSYNDFEFIIENKNNRDKVQFKDKRIKYNCHPTGNHIFHINTIAGFKDKQYVKYILASFFNE